LLKDDSYDFRPVGESPNNACGDVGVGQLAPSGS
jgi:hypothetical protein